MYRIRSFGNDQSCSSVSELSEALQSYSGKSITIVVDGKLNFVDVASEPGANGKLVLHDSYQGHEVTLAGICGGGLCTG